MKRFAVGIDLGTTNSAIACIDPHRRPAVIKNAQGERTTPSVVFFPPDPDEDVLVGTAAKRMRAGCPERTVVCVKRQMGNPHYRFKWSEDDEADPAQLSSLILGALIRDGERRLDGKIDRAVITVPAYFHDLERNRTKEAGRLAGLESVALINEPTAAAQAWAYEAGEDARGACVMVYDLGGGTFDVTVLRDEGGGSFLVVSTDGDPLLGGRDFDIALLRYFIEQFQAKHGIEPGEEDGSIFEWEERAEDAKKQLSVSQSTPVILTVQGRTLRLDLERRVFEDLIRPRVEDSLIKCRQALERADPPLAWKDIHQILLVGGSTRIPMVSRRLHEVSGRMPSARLDPDEVVAQGAAVHCWRAFEGGAAAESGASARPSSNAPGVLPVDDAPPLDDALPPPPKDLAEFTDVVTHDLGIEVVGNRVRNLLRRNTPLRGRPPQASASYRFNTAVDNQEAVEIRLYQGEGDTPDLLTRVGTVRLGPIPPRPRGRSPILVKLTCNHDGVILVHAGDEASGKSVQEEVAVHDVDGGNRRSRRGKGPP